MKKNLAVRLIALLGALGIILAALLPAFAGA